MTSRSKKQYLIGLDMTPVEQDRLRKFASMTTEKSIRAFVKTAIENEINARLEDMDISHRHAIERLMG